MLRRIVQYFENLKLIDKLFTIGGLYWLLVVTIFFVVITLTLRSSNAQNHYFDLSRTLTPVSTGIEQHYRYTHTLLHIGHHSKKYLDHPEIYSNLQEQSEELSSNLINSVDYELSRDVDTNFPSKLKKDLLEQHRYLDIATLYSSSILSNQLLINETAKSVKDGRHNLRNLADEIGDTDLKAMINSISYLEKEFLIQYQDEEHFEELSQEIDKLEAYISESPDLDPQVKQFLEDYRGSINSISQPTLELASLNNISEYLSSKSDAIHKNTEANLLKYQEYITTKYDLSIRNAQLLIKLSILIIFAFTLLATLSIYLFGSKVSKPLVALTKDANKFKHGEIEQININHSKDEVGQLSRAYSGLVSKINSEKSKLEVTLESIGDGALVVDKNRRITFLNKVGLEMSGHNYEEIKDKPYNKVLKFIKEADGEPNNHFIEEAIDKGKITRMSNSTLLVGKQGKQTHVSDSASPIIDSSGETVGAIVIFRDVSFEREANKKINAINQLREKFIQVISHQMGTPLNIVRWNLESLLGGDMGKLTKQQKDFVQMTHDQEVEVINRVRAMITTLDLEEGKVVPEKELISVEELWNEVLPMWQKQAQAKDITYEYTQPTNPLPKVNADPKQIKFVLTALTNNATQYTKKRGKNSVKLFSTSKSVRFEIEDTGIGIPAKDKDKIFERFYRASNAHSLEPDKSGIELYIAKKYITLNNGKIGFISTENKGSTFAFELPLA